MYLDRLWRDERQVARDLAKRASEPIHVAPTPLAAGLARLFDQSDDDPDLQRLAAAAAVVCRVSVVAGGPGTGKTRTVARVLALLDELAEADAVRPPRIALAAPTGKAAARLEAAMRAGADDMPVQDAVRARLRALRASTIHRLLGFNPGNRSRFRHNRDNRLPFDVVVVDETSMVSLSLMARLVEAVRPEARLILVGDPEQLASVEAGAVLGDIVGPASLGICMADATRARLAELTEQDVPAAPGPARAHRGRDRRPEEGAPLRRGDRSLRGRHPPGRRGRGNGRARARRHQRRVGRGRRCPTSTARPALSSLAAAPCARCAPSQSRAGAP